MDDNTLKRIQSPDFELVFQRLSKDESPVDNDISDEYLRILGEIIYRFQALEATVIYYIGLSTEISFLYVGIIAAGTTFKGLVDLAETFSRMNGESEAEDMKILIKQMRLAEDIRNSIVHSFWSGQEPDPLTRSKYHKKQFIQHYEHSITELKGISEWLYKLQVCIAALNSKVDPDFPQIVRPS